MSDRNEDTIKQLLSTVAGVAGSYFSSATGFLIPLGGLMTLAYLYYKFFHKDPFRASDEELRRYIREAIEKEAECRKALEDLNRVKGRVDRGEISVESTVSLEARMKQLEECIKLATAKKMICEAIIMVKENIEVYRKLLGERGFDKLASNVGELNGLVEKTLKKAEIKEAEYEEIARYLRNLFPLIIEEPEKFKSEVRQESTSQPKAPQTKGVAESSIIDDLIYNGSVEDWLNLLGKSVKNKVKIKLPAGRHSTRRGFRNLLIALYATELDISTLREVIEDRYLVRAMEYLRRLREGETIKVEPLSSDKEYIDEILEMIKEGEVERRVEDNIITKIYRFVIPKGAEVEIERQVKKDSVSGVAVGISYRKL